MLVLLLYFFYKHFRDICEGNRVGESKTMQIYFSKIYLIYSCLWNMKQISCKFKMLLLIMGIEIA